MLFIYIMDTTDDQSDHQPFQIPHCSYAIEANYEEEAFNSLVEKIINDCLNENDPLLEDGHAEFIAESIKGCYRISGFAQVAYKGPMASDMTMTDFETIAYLANQ